MIPDHSRVAYLDGWRVIAVMLVLGDHLAQNPEIDSFYARHGLRFLAEYGEVGVFIFFFISGRVVSQTCLREIEKTGNFEPGAFYVRRFFRIVPPLILYLGFCQLIGQTGAIKFSFQDFLSSALFLCNTTTPSVSCEWYVGHTWSLAFEAQFYLCFPILLAWFELGKRPTLSNMLAVFPFVALPLIFTIWWIGKSGFLIAYALFLIGYFLAKREAWVFDRVGPWRRPLLFVSAFLVFLPRGVVAMFGDSESERAALIDGLRLVYIFAVPTLVFLAGAAGSATRAILSNGRLCRVGRATYSIYLWQQLITGAPINQMSAPFELGLLGVMILSCMALYTHWEVKLIDLGRRLCANRARAPAIVQTLIPTTLTTDPSCPRLSRASTP